MTIRKKRGGGGQNLDVDTHGATEIIFSRLRHIARSLEQGKHGMTDMNLAANRRVAFIYQAVENQFNCYPILF